MRVHAVCGYPGKSDAWNGEWDNEHYRARNLIKGVKKEAFNGYSEWTPRQTGKPIKQYSNASGNKIALAAAASKICDLIDKAGIKLAAVVPVPSSQTIAAGGDYAGARLAEAIQVRRPGLIARPVLYFDTQQPKAHHGGERRWHMILPHLRGGGGLSGTIVLLDDVMTGGGHLRACRRFLHAKGLRVDDAFVIGRTLWEPPETMFKMPVEMLPF